MGANKIISVFVVVTVYLIGMPFLFKEVLSKKFPGNLKNNGSILGGGRVFITKTPILC